ncbi:MAG: DUF3874 domain-containing protein [Prevotella sp.]|nr:DUF3874 domain-containing protein [Prevotella sp.]
MINIFNLTNKLQQCNTYIGQLEEQNRLLSENLTKAAAADTADEQARYQQRKRALLRPIREMTDFVNREFEFRHNVVRDSYEYRRRDGAGEWLPVDERQMNTIMNNVQDEGQVFCLKSLVQQRIRSEMARDYHPVADWLDTVRGTWDGQDRIADLCARINPSDYCREMMTIWLRAVVAQWMGVDDRHANAVMLLLVSPTQGLHKSTFLHELLPEELESYYTDDFALSSKGNAERKLVEFALVSIDEFDKLPVKKMPDLKTLMQTLRPSFVKAYKTNFNLLPRIASFVGTSNSRQLLSDRTGSRRFLILEPQGVIPVDGIDHRQLYAQLVTEVEQGQRYYFTKDEEQRMQRQNEQYYRLSPLEDLFLRFFRVPQPDDVPAGEETDASSPRVQQLSASQLMSQLSRHSPKLLKDVSETAFGKMMTRLGIPRDHLHTGNFYRVVAL